MADDDRIARIRARATRDYITKRLATVKGGAQTITLPAPTNEIIVSPEIIESLIRAIQDSQAETQAAHAADMRAMIAEVKALVAAVVSQKPPNVPEVVVNVPAPVVNVEAPKEPKPVKRVAKFIRDKDGEAIGAELS